MVSSAYVNTRILRIHSCKKKKKKRRKKGKRETTPAETKNSQTQILEVKRTTNFPKQLLICKSKGTQEQTISLLEASVKRYLYVLKRNN